MSSQAKLKSLKTFSDQLLKMKTNLDLNDELLAEAFRLTNLKTEQELIDFALQELIRTRKKRNLLEFSGQIQFAPDYDYKASRENRHVSDWYLSLDHRFAR